MLRRSLLLATAVLIASALPVVAQEKPRHGGELVVVVPSSPPSYDAHREETFGTIHPIAPHYNTLLRTDPTDRTGTKVVADLAESWTISKDGRTYTLKLRHGVKFHDGSEFTSKDAKASYDKIVNPPAGVASNRKGEYVDVEAIQAPDPYTVVFRLKYPSASFLNSLASPWNWIYKADILAKDMRWYEQNVMGTGPFLFVEHVKRSRWPWIAIRARRRSRRSPSSRKSAASRCRGRSSRRRLRIWRNCRATVTTSTRRGPRRAASSRRPGSPTASRSSTRTAASPCPTSRWGSGSSISGDRSASMCGRK